MMAALELFYSDRFCVYRNIIALIGIAWVARCTLKTLLSLCRVLRTYYLAPWGISRVNLRKHGEWASECALLQKDSEFVLFQS